MSLLNERRNSQSDDEDKDPSKLGPGYTKPHYDDDICMDLRTEERKREDEEDESISPNPKKLKTKSKTTRTKSRDRHSRSRRQRSSENDGSLAGPSDDKENFPILYASFNSPTSIMTRLENMYTGANPSERGEFFRRSPNRGSSQITNTRTSPSTRQSPSITGTASFTNVISPSRPDTRRPGDPESPPPNLGRRRLSYEQPPPHLRPGFAPFPLPEEEESVFGRGDVVSPIPDDLVVEYDVPNVDTDTDRTDEKDKP